jgi:hypothetical protein
MRSGDIASRISYIKKYPYFMGLMVIRFWCEFISQKDRSGNNLCWLEKAFL